MLKNFFKNHKNRKKITSVTKNYKKAQEKILTRRLKINKTVDFFDVAWYNTKRV